MTVDPGAARALEHLSARAADVQRAFTPGAQPAFDDVLAQTNVARADVNPLAAAPPEGTYFVTRDALDRTLYTRDGGFVLREGAIANADGCAVLGRAAPGGPLVPLRIDAVDAALGRVRNLHVEADGSIVYERAALDPRSGRAETERVTVGRVALARFPAGSRPVAASVNHVAAPPGVVPFAGLPGDGTFAPVQPMHRAQSSIDIDRSLLALDDAYLQLDAIVATQRSQYASAKTAMDLLK
jgi:hypothetical protein